MASREHSAYDNNLYPGHSGRYPNHEDTINTETIQVERKTFIFTLKENPRGRFLRITEDVGGRRDTIILPAPGMAQFRQVLDDMLQIDAELSDDGS